MRRLAAFGLLALPTLPAAASAQTLPLLPPVGFKIGYYQGELPGVAAGLDFKLPTQPIRLDADVWSAFSNFGDRDAGTAFTVNYFKQLPIVYVGGGVGYSYGRDGDGHFNTVVGKLFVGGKVPFLGTGVEGAVILGEHTLGTISLVYRF